MIIIKVSRYTNKYFNAMLYIILVLYNCIIVLYYTIILLYYTIYTIVID